MPAKFDNQSRMPNDEWPAGSPSGLRLSCGLLKLVKIWSKKLP